MQAQFTPSNLTCSVSIGDHLNEYYVTINVGFYHL